MEIRRDELFHFLRWMNLIIGFNNLWWWYQGAGYHMLALGLLNTAVWALTRKPKEFL